MAMGHTTGHKSVDFASIMADRDERLYPSTGPIIDSGVTGVTGVTGIMGVTAATTVRGRQTPFAKP